MESELKRLTVLSEERLVAAENVRNELLTAQNQLRGLDEQISKDRGKLLKLREDKRILLEQASPFVARLFIIVDKALLESGYRCSARKLTSRTTEKIDFAW